MDSWIQKVEASEYRPLLASLFDRYVDVTLDWVRRNCKQLVSLPAISQAQTLCNILEGFLPQASQRLSQSMNVCSRINTLLVKQESVRGGPPPDKWLLEHYFVFACIWAFGGCLLVDKINDYLAVFSSWWKSEWKTVAFPEGVRRFLWFAHYILNTL